jgi:hypothetical protein
MEMKETKPSIAGYKPAKHEQKLLPTKQSAEVNSNSIKVCVCTKCKCNKGSQND